MTTTEDLYQQALRLTERPGSLDRDVKDIVDLVLAARPTPTPSAPIVPSSCRPDAWWLVRRKGKSVLRIGARSDSIARTTPWLLIVGTPQGIRTTYHADAEVEVVAEVTARPEPTDVEILRRARQIGYDQIGPRPWQKDMEVLADRLEAEYKAAQEQAERDASIRDSVRSEIGLVTGTEPTYYLVESVVARLRRDGHLTDPEAVTE